MKIWILDWTERIWQIKTKYDSGDEPKIGDIVLIEDDSYKRQDWEIGCIKESTLSRDKRIEQYLLIQ